MVTTRSQRKEEEPKVGTKRKRPTTTKTVSARKKKEVEDTPSKVTRTRKAAKQEPEESKKSRKTPKRKNAALAVLSKAEEKQQQKNEAIEQSMSDETIKPKLKKVNRDLLNSVRRREIQHKIDLENCTKEKLHTKSLLAKMPSICGYLRSYYRSQRKTVMDMDLITKQLCEMTTPPTPKSDLVETLDLLLQIAPTWCATVTVNNRKYLKINTSQPIGEVKQEIAKQIEEMDI